MIVDKTEVAAFFDAKSDTWDDNSSVNADAIEHILDLAEISADHNVLDVACGTGVLVPFLAKRNCGSVTCADISPGMIDRAVSKFSSSQNVRFICCDAETFDFGVCFDRIVIYNAFPHFSSPEKLFSNLSRYLCRNGILAVAHGASRSEIDRIHHSDAAKVSNGLMAAEELGKIMSEFFDVHTVCSDENIYFVSGVRR